jgi:hypothetical protein
MNDKGLEMSVALALDENAELAEIEERTLQLRRELLDLDLEEVRQPTVDTIPDGAKAADATLVGMLVVTASREAVSAVIHLLSDWLSRTGGRSVKVQVGTDVLELSRASKEDQERLVDAFLARQTSLEGTS